MPRASSHNPTTPAATGPPPSPVRPYYPPTGGRGELVVGFGPAAEPFPELSQPGGAFANWGKCRAFIGQLKRLLGPPPQGCELFIRQHGDADRPFYNVHLRYRGAGAERRDAATDYVVRLQERCPTHWDAAAAQELGITPGNPAPANAAADKTEAADLTPRQLGILKKAYVELGRTSDELSLSPEAAAQLQKLFAKRARKDAPAKGLVARIMAERKKGGWPCLRNGGGGADGKPQGKPPVSPAKRKTAKAAKSAAAA